VKCDAKADVLIPAQDVEVALEVRLVTVPEVFFERIGVDFNAPAAASNGGPTWVPVPMAAQVAVNPLKKAVEQGAFLNDKQVAQLLEAAQGDQRACVLQAPKITLLDGQTGHVNCTDKQSYVTDIHITEKDGQKIVTPKNEEIVTGFQMSARPVVSADRRYVRLDLNVNQTDLASSAVPLFPIVVHVPNDQGKPVAFTQFIQQPKVNTVRIEKKLTIPDGGTVLLGGLRKEVEVRRECGPPVLDQVPYVNRLFKNVGCAREAQTVYVLVTPRVLVNEESEKPAKAAACTRSVPLGGCCEDHCESSVPARTVSAPVCGHARALAELLKAYDAACAEGHAAEATRLAQAALILDPTCFARKK
jgi:type II secretory pathway component GspD/PulD (secretin)